ncbi:HpcH/HpaI aldolase/citrate lyase family protein [Halobium salinum]|uniref:HpcH/HpaI aldolase/citrate lyase family protein n=1 Tax=Halobium salinum TaxID=1364940 RepID=A0ABD5PCI5_9EURY|nr:aldolase/citrate lyase family protein [Halobium salinum]
MTDSPRSNGLRETMADGVAFGVLDNTYSPALVELYGEMGFDFVWFDLEHGGPSPWDATALEDALRAAELTDTELLVRLPSADPAMVRKVLDAGVRNLFVSRVWSAEEVRTVVEAARFEYAGEPGERGLGSPRASRWGLAGDDYVPVEDEEILVGVTVETEAAVDAIDEILAVPELGFVFVGPFDLSVALGHPGEVDHEAVQAAVETVRDDALDADVSLGGLGFGDDDVRSKVEQGYSMLNVGSTVGAIRGTFPEKLEAYRDAV